MRTPATKRVRSEYLMGNMEVLTTVIEQDKLLDQWTPQFDVRVIGWHFETEIQYAEETPADKDMVRTAGFIGRGAAQDLDNRWAVLHETMLFLVGTGSTCVIGDIMAVEDVIFPEGYGFDIDEGESVYLFGTVRNNSAQKVNLNCTCVMYWVPRNA